MSDILNNRNKWVVILVVFMIAIGGSVVASNLSMMKTKNQIDYLYTKMKPILDQNPQPVTEEQNSDMNKLSAKANKLIDRVGEKITGTPTWLIDGVVYKGFDYRNNLVPELESIHDAKEIIIFSSPTCGFCEKAEEYLKSENIKYDKVCYPLHSGDYDKCDETYIK